MIVNNQLKPKTLPKNLDGFTLQISDAFNRKVPESTEQRKQGLYR